MRTKTGEKEFVKTFTGICEVFDKKYSKALLSIYFEVLKKFHYQEVQVAINKCVSNNKWFPRPSEILEALGTGKVADKNNGLVMANEILAHLKRYGSTKFPECVVSDPVANSLMSRTWPYKSWASTVLEDDLKWWVKEFCAAYEAYSETDTSSLIEGPADILKIANDATKSIDY